MPNRYVREAAIESEPVNSLGWQAEVFWRRLINRVDDFGRFTGNHSLLRALIFPLQLSRVRESDMKRLLAECERAGLLFTYSIAGKQFLVLNKWEKGRAKTSDYPPPPADICERMQTFVYGCKQTFANVPDSDSDSDHDSDAGRADAPAVAAPASNSEWLASLKANAAYSHVNIEREHAKMLVWCGAHKKQPTRRRFIAWLNRCEPPLLALTSQASKPAAPEPDDWRAFLNQEHPDSVYAEGGDMAGKPWAELGQTVQRWILSEMHKYNQQTRETSA
jgi:hypothetical protein